MLLFDALPPSFVYGFVSGSIGYFLCRYLSPLITNIFATKQFQQRVNLLDIGKAYHYHSLLPSTIHVLLQVIGTYSVVFYGRERYDNVNGISPNILFDDRTHVEYGLTGIGPAVYSGVFVGYLFSDILASPSLKSMGYPFVLHHIAAILCWIFCAHNKVMQPIACLFQFNELSTPLMNIRQYLLTAGYKSSDLSVSISSLIFFIVFGLVRVVPLPFVIKNWIHRDFDAIRLAIGSSGAILLSVFFAVNALLQCGWFLIMIQKLISMLSSKKTKKKKQ